jgi:hypothetical protein
MMIAEGSDWFWWYGDDHQTENAAEFDGLFRGHLKNVYRLLNEAPPLRLDESIKKTIAGTQYRSPVHTITPRLDGKTTSYFDWLSAGSAVPGGGGSMYRTDRFLDKILFGFDLRNFYLKIDLAPAKMMEFPPTNSIQVQFTSPKECLLALECEEKNIWRCRTIQWPAPDKPPAFAGFKILELGIPLDVLEVREPVEVTFFVTVLDNGREVERLPSTGLLSVHTDPWSLDQQEWIV